jgi:hypothetical protein
VSEQLIDIHKEKYPGLAVFCISNIIYSDDYWEGHRELANIRELRDYCKFVPAADQMRSTSTFLDHQVPALLLSLRQWALSGTDLVTAERADILGVVLEHAREALEQVCPFFKERSSGF